MIYIYKVWIRICVMLFIPFVCLGVLLGLGMSAQTSQTAMSQHIFNLAHLVEAILRVAYQLSVEETDCLWCFPIHTFDWGTGSIPLFIPTSTHIWIQV